MYTAISCDCHTSSLTAGDVVCRLVASYVVKSSSGDWSLWQQYTNKAQLSNIK